MIILLCNQHKGNWRIIIIVKWVVYLLTFGIALAIYLKPPASLEVHKWLQMVFFGLATFVFLAPFSLSGSLMKIQMERYKVALEETGPKVVTDAKKAAKKIRR